MPCTEPLILAKITSTVPTWRILKQGTLTTKSFQVTSFCWPKITKRPCFFARSRRGPNVVYTFGQEKPTPFFLGLFKGHPFLRYFFYLLCCYCQFQKAAQNQNIYRSVVSHKRAHRPILVSFWLFENSACFSPKFAVPQSIKSKASLKSWTSTLTLESLSWVVRHSHLTSAPQGDMSCTWKCCGNNYKITGPFIGNLETSPGAFGLKTTGQAKSSRAIK